MTAVRHWDDVILMLSHITLQFPEYVIKTEVSRILTDRSVSDSSSDIDVRFLEKWAFQQSNGDGRVSTNV